MIDEPTLFILGAGSSKPYGFPTGRELRHTIIDSFSTQFTKLLNEDSSVNQLHRSVHIVNATEFVESFSKSPVYSIDQYLAINPDYQPYGKMAIAYYIRKSEIESRFLEVLMPPHYEEDWYSLLFNRMVADFKQSHDFEKFKDNKIAFITFNYDRSLEYFLYTSFLNTFSQGRREFQDKLNQIIHFPIIHVYGQIGKVRKQEGEQWGGYLHYYRDHYSITFKEVEGLAGGIGIIGERSVEDTRRRITEIVLAHKRIFICGFGYAKENVEVIGLPSSIDDKWKIFGTAKGMTTKEMRDVKSVLGGNYRQALTAENQIRIENKNSYELLREYL